MSDGSSTPDGRMKVAQRPAINDAATAIRLLKSYVTICNYFVQMPHRIMLQVVESLIGPETGSLDK